MKKVLLSAAAFLLMQLGATAQISALPASQNFTDAFAGEFGTAIAIYPNYTANEVQESTRFFRDVTVYSSSPAALAAIPTSGFTGELVVNFNLTSYSNVSAAFVAKSMKNGEGTRPSTISFSTSIDGGTTWGTAQEVASLPNEDQTSFTNYSYTFPATTNNQASVLLKLIVGTGTGGSGTRAKVVIDDLQFAVTSTPQLALGTTALTFNQTLGVPSQPQFVAVSGSNLTADATLTVAAPFEVSLSATTGFSTSVTVPQAAGAIASTNVYVRLNAAAAGPATGTLTATSGTATATTALTGVVIESACTNPAPFSLASGNYSFTSWAADAAAGTYPANMVFWTHATTDPTIDTPFNEDYTCLYNLTTRSRFTGQGDNGVSMVNTGNSQFTGVCSGDDPAQATGDTVLNGRSGAVVLGLNTTGRQDVVVGWKGTTVAPNSRVYGLRLQYRIGAGTANANWTDVTNGEDAFTQYTSSTTAGESQTFTTALPAAVNNQAEVQVRWVYNFIDTGVTGSRAEVGLDDVTVTTNELLGNDTFTKNGFAMYPNPATAIVSFTKPVAITVYDFTGKTVFASATEINTLNVSGFAAGIYLVKTANGGAQKLIVR